MDFIGIIIFILFLAIKVFGKLGQESGPDGAPQRPRRMPPWFPDFDETTPPVFDLPDEKRRTLPVNRVPGDGGPDKGSPEPVVAKTAKKAKRAAHEAEPAPAAAPVSGLLENQSALIQEPAAEDIIKGVIWAEILSPPRAKRPFAADCLRR